MDWILNHLFTILVIAGVLAQLVQAIRGKKQADGDDTTPETPAREYEFEDPELSQRTRDIREQIRRKIAERQRADGAPAPVAVEPEPPLEETPPLLRDEEEFKERMEAPSAYDQAQQEREPAQRPSVWENRRTAELLEQQAALAEKLQEAQLMKAAALKRKEFEATTRMATTSALRVETRELIDGLRDPKEMRRAFLMREIIGPPLALRR